MKRIDVLIVSSQFTYLLLALISFQRESLTSQFIDNSPKIFRLAVLFVFLVLLAHYILLTLIITFNSLKIPNISSKKIILWTAPTAIILFITLPFLSADIFLYLARAKSFLLGFNPYKVPLADTAVYNSWAYIVDKSSWYQKTSGYGPLFNLITPLVISPAAGFELFGAVYAYKFVVLLFYACSVWIFKKLIDQLDISQEFILLYVLNPSLALHTVMDGHNDVFVLFFMLLGLYLLFENKKIYSMLSISASIAFKYLTIPLLPIYWIKQGKLNPKALLGSIGIAILLFAAASVVFGFPFESMLNMLLFQSNSGCLYVCYPVTAILKELLGRNVYLAKIILSVLAYIGAICYFLTAKTEQKENLLKFSFWLFIIILFISLSWTTPWYFVYPISLGILIAGRQKNNSLKQNYLTAVFILTSLSLFQYFF